MTTITSKRIADDMAMSLNTLVVSLWDAAHALRHGTKEDRRQAKERLQRAERFARELEAHGTRYSESLSTFYGLKSRDLPISQIPKYIKELQGSAGTLSATELDRIIEELRTLNRKLQERIGEVLPESSLE